MMISFSAGTVTSGACVPQVVDNAHPLPVAISGGLVGLDVNVVDVDYKASGLASVTGTFVAAGQSATFTPQAGRAFNITLTGTFVASVQLERFMGGTWVPITAVGTQIMIWTAPASEQWSDDENAVGYRLNCTARTSGTVTYLISQ